MQIVKLDATDSTNAWLKEFWQENSTEDWVVVWAKNQTGGRGQQGTEWESEPGKNLTISVLKKFDRLKISEQFYLNIGVSLAVYEVLKTLGVPEIYVKWPNDIMSGSDKLCGILIENMVKASNVSASVIGIGLNVNQIEFPGLEQATSIHKVTGKVFDLDEVLYLLLEQLKLQLEILGKTNLTNLKASYESVMYRVNTVSKFNLPDGTKVSGEILGVDNTGRLLVRIRGDVQSFDTKEIQFAPDD